MNIVVLDGFTLNPGDLSWDGLRQYGDVTVYDRTDSRPDKIIDAVGKAEIVFTNKTPLQKGVLEKLTTVRYIGVLATGYNVVDVIAARESGIVVTNIPSYATAAVAQFTFALLLELCHHAGAHNDAVQSGEWSASNDFCFWKYPLMELAGKTMGLIGFGRIGQSTAKIAQTFGLKVLVYDNSVDPSLETENCKFVTLDELLEHSDIISLHCPLLETTKGMINNSNIAMMKDGVIIINTSRGQLIVEEDLRDALNNGKVAGAAVDVVSYEPISGENPLLHARNCIITPHIAWASKEARIRLMNTAVENLEAFLAGKPVNVVTN